VELFQKNLNFAFEYQPHPNSSRILNRHPLPGEPAEYENDAAAPSHRTYAVIALVPNLSNTGWVLIIEGLTLAGTQAAVETLFYQLVSNAGRGPKGLGPYAVSFVFAVGVVFCTIPLNALFMRKPLNGSAPVPAHRYRSARPIWHLWAIIGGAILNFVASHAALIGPAVSYAIGQGATMISAIWGVFVWKEFADAPKASRKLLPYMFICFIMGLGAIAMAPLLGKH